MLNKPDKIFLNNPNLHEALSLNRMEVGTLRESFFVNQLQGLHKLTLPVRGDFLVDNTYTFEIGGKNKTKSQINGIPNAYLVKDTIENGTNGVIPLWLFGFMY